MNVTKLKQLLELIDGLPPERVDMRNWVKKGSYECGTVACIAGHWALSELGDLRLDDDGFPVLLGLMPIDAAGREFDLTLITAERLFRAEAHAGEVGYFAEHDFVATRDDAIARIRRLIETGDPRPDAARWLACSGD